MSKEIIPFYVINENFNAKKFEKYNIMPYFINSYKETLKRDRPSNFEDFKQFVINKSHYMYWARCEYEIVLKSWVNRSEEEKIDIHWQIMMNIDLITKILMYNLNIK